MSSEKYWSEKSFESYKSELELLKNNKEIINSSFDFLAKKIAEFEKNWKLENNEIDFLNKQIIYHKKLWVLKNEFLKKKWEYSDKSIEDLEKLYNEVEWTIISDIELNYLNENTNKQDYKTKDTLIFYNNKTFRDYIETNIDVKWEIESVFNENEKTKEFYKIFTLEYLNFFESKFNEKQIIKMHLIPEKWLPLNEEELNNLLYKTVSKNLDFFKKFNKNLKININWKTHLIKISDILQKIEQKKENEKWIQEWIKKELSEIRNQIIKEEKEKIKKNNRLDLLDELLTKNNKLKTTVNAIGKITPLQKNDNAKIVKEKFIRFLIISWTLEKKEILRELLVNNSLNEMNSLDKFQDILKNNWEIEPIRKINKEYAISLLNDLIHQTDDLNTTTIKTEAINNSSKKKNKNTLEQQNIDFYENRYINSLLSNWDISKDKLLQKLEASENFNYLDFIDRYWLSEEVENAYLSTFARKMENFNVYIDWKVIKITPEFIQKNKKIILNNLRVMNKIIVWIECSGENRDNNQWSWAKWYFQFHTQNGSEDRSKWEYNSLETALRRSYTDLAWIKYIPNEKLEKHKNVPEWIVDTYNKKNADPKDLTANKQNTLFIYDMFNNWKTITDSNNSERWVKDFIWLVIMWNPWSAEKFYEFFHHTAADSATKERVREYSNKYMKEFIKIS